MLQFSEFHFCSSKREEKKEKKKKKEKWFSIGQAGSYDRASGAVMCYKKLI
jgi:hypothetical protein